MLGKYLFNTGRRFEECKVFGRILFCLTYPLNYLVFEVVDTIITVEGHTIYTTNLNSAYNSVNYKLILTPPDVFDISDVVGTLAEAVGLWVYSYKEN